MGLRSFAIDGRQAPPFHETIKSGLSTGDGIAAELRGDPKRKPQRPSNKEAGLDANHHVLFPARGGREFSLDILFHRMSEIAIFHGYGPEAFTARLL